MEQLLQEIQKLHTELADIKQRLEITDSAKHFDDWIPHRTLKHFMGYKDTQFAEFLKSEKLKVAKIGIHKFIKKQSFLKLLEDKILKS